MIFSQLFVFFTRVFEVYILFWLPLLNKLALGALYVKTIKLVNSTIIIKADNILVVLFDCSSMFINLYATYSPSIMLIINVRMSSIKKFVPIIPVYV